MAFGLGERRISERKVLSREKVSEQSICKPSVHRSMLLFYQKPISQLWSIRPYHTIRFFLLYLYAPYHSLEVRENTSAVTMNSCIVVYSMIHTEEYCKRWYHPSRSKITIFLPSPHLKDHIVVRTVYTVQYSTVIFGNDWPGYHRHLLHYWLQSQ